ncbi:MAG: signal peptidase I [Ruminococcus sp.]|nr:signal peptidase I [Ruminococcus sp.]
MEENETTASPAAGAAESEKKPSKKRTAKSYAISFFVKAGISALVLWVLFTFVISVCVCHTNSAYPAIRDGEFCLINRLSEPEQGTMIVYRHDGEIHFGRVIGSGGDKIEIFNDYVTVNDYGIFENVVYPTSPEGSAISYPYTVDENCVFVMNDYRMDITDSRTYGGIPQGDIIGKVVFTMRMRGI